VQNRLADLTRPQRRELGGPEAAAGGLEQSWRHTPRSNWNSATDVDGDGAINLADLKILVVEWNKILN
jgi:hypothetical protein